VLLTYRCLTSQTDQLQQLLLLALLLLQVLLLQVLLLLVHPQRSSHPADHPDLQQANARP